MFINFDSEMYCLENSNKSVRKFKMACGIFKEHTIRSPPDEFSCERKLFVFLPSVDNKVFMSRKAN